MSEIQVKAQIYTDGYAHLGPQGLISVVPGEKPFPHEEDPLDPHQTVLQGKDHLAVVRRITGMGNGPLRPNTPIFIGLYHLPSRLNAEAYGKLLDILRPAVDDLAEIHPKADRPTEEQWKKVIIQAQDILRRVEQQAEALREHMRPLDSQPPSSRTRLWSALVYVAIGLICAAIPVLWVGFPEIRQSDHHRSIPAQKPTRSSHSPSKDVSPAPSVKAVVSQTTSLHAQLPGWMREYSENDIRDALLAAYPGGFTVEYILENKLEHKDSLLPGSEIGEGCNAVSCSHFLFPNIAHGELGSEMVINGRKWIHRAKGILEEINSSSKRLSNGDFSDLTLRGRLNSKWTIEDIPGLARFTSVPLFDSGDRKLIECLQNWIGVNPRQDMPGKLKERLQALNVEIESAWKRSVSGEETDIQNDEQKRDENKDKPGIFKAYDQLIKERKGDIQKSKTDNERRFSGLTSSIQCMIDHLSSDLETHSPPSKPTAVSPDPR